MKYPRSLSKNGREMELHWLSNTMLGDHFCWPFPFPVPRSDLFPSDRGCQTSQGPTPDFWEVAQGRWPRMWVQRSVTQHQPQQCTIMIPTLSLESPRDQCRCYLSSFHPFPSPPAHHMQHQCLFSSWVSAKSWTPPRSRETWLNLWLPPPLTLFSKNSGLPSKSFQDLILNLILLKIRNQRGKMAYLWYCSH